MFWFVFRRRLASVYTYGNEAKKVKKHYVLLFGCTSDTSVV